MDLGEIGVILVAEGEAEARAAVERFVRARDAAVRSMEDAAQREVRAAQAVERAIQREIREYDSLVRSASGLKRSYEDLVASFNPLNRAQLQYARNIETLDAALEANVINEQQRTRAMELLRQRMESTVEAEKAAELQRVAQATAQHTREIQSAQEAYDRLLASIDPLVAAQQKYERGIDTLNQAEAKRIITTEERINAEKQLESQLARDTTSVRAAQARQEQQALQASQREHAQLTGEVQRLQAATNPAIRAQQMYDQAIKTTERAVKAGILTQQEAIQTMEDVRQQMASVGHIVNQNGLVMSRADTAYQRWARGGLQNAGYQVADFAVQVQGGTSAVVAFGQQAPQLLGTFGAWGAIVGAAVAVGAALVTMFINMRGEAKSTEDQLRNLSEAISSLEEVSVGSGNTMASSFKVVRQEAQALIEELRKVRTEQLNTEIEGLMNSLPLKQLLSDLNQGIMDTFSQEAMSGVGRSLQEITEELASSYEIMGLTVNEANILNGMLSSIGGTTRQEVAQSFFEVVERAKALNLVNDETRVLINQIATELNLVDYAFLEVENSAAGVTRELQGISDLINSIAGQVSSLSLGNIGRQARLAALQAGQSIQDAEFAGFAASERAKLAPALGSGDAAIRAAAQQQLDQLLGAKQQELQLEASINEQLKIRREAEKEENKGGKAKEQKDVLADLVQRVRLERELLGVSESEREVRTAVARADMQYSEQAIANAIAILEAERAIIEQRKEMERLTEFIGDQFGDALMSIVDGTSSVKDAFKNMARVVIAELYRVIVVQRIVAAFSGALGGPMSGIAGLFANGAAFSGGNVVPYADGGVVTRPTLFGMSNGKTGLMGEAGPEAILPLKRGSDGKLGVAASGGGSITVQNNITVNGSDAESVRREVAKMIPQITQVTKAAVIDAKQRGGQMSSAFR